MKLSCISTVSPRLKLCIIYASFTHLKLWKPTYEQPSIQAKLQKLAKQHNSFDKLVQHNPLMQKLQKEIAQEGYKLTWKSKNILPAVPYEELAAYYSYLSKHEDWSLSSEQEDGRCSSHSAFLQWSENKHRSFITGTYNWGIF
ncbi:hypothetical protein [Brevibacillus halotolerans]|uniref:hypothetical protein n=1 Tax=Brevibacillus halotolerans TaxID=1507437 RepID=UPI0015EF836B|nr:hypothetical protein [Brevibacillus halotolerans]MBA4532010.1 hypothetical protein [Brevibacillus halotolerans]